MVVSAADDRSYEIIYKGKLLRNNPFTTVLVANDNVVPEKQAQMMSPTSRVTSSSDAAVSKIPDVQSVVRPTTAGKSLCLINKLTSGTQPLPAPTHAPTSPVSPHPRPQRCRRG
jgi:hypothetical protein